MKFCTIRIDGHEEAAVHRPHGLVPIGRLNAVAHGNFSSNLRELVQDSPLSPLATELERLSVTAPTIADHEVEFGPLYRDPPKLWGVGLNFRRHADELNVKLLNEQPGSYMRPNTTLIGNGDFIQLPSDVGRVTAEAELGVVIGKRCRNVPLSDARSVIFGYTCVLDMTAEDLIRRNPRYIPVAKAYDTFCSVGPWLVTEDEIEDLDAVSIATILNGSVHAENTVSSMTYRPYWLVSHYSKIMTLEPGDIISTGTPGATVIHNGDVVGARINGIGNLVNYVEDPHT
ncbi:MAG: fumarylacetoacetate hydrolase family protein, partial [Candidatus Dormibacteraceae bacterium]